MQIPECALASSTQGAALGNPGPMVELDGEACDRTGSPPRAKRALSNREPRAKPARVAAPSVF